ncbi:hypothetical protein [uncultured Sphaerochaeta sp.]|uniref:hypothetical protein n=1 Tax=uncultured Sphaerochaeta sp. TaxID=886478 RepID=UPI002A0A71AE|nr:hypothetical protein [uncultured Sphaerochaeta sp.]
MDTSDQLTIEEEKDVALESKSIKDYFSDFYKLEQIIKSSVESPYQHNYPLYKAIDILYKSGTIDYGLTQELNAIRKYRNSVVHGSNPIISKHALENLKKVKSILENYIDKPAD